MKVPLGMNREDISPVDSVLNRHPELQDAMQDLLKGPLAGNTMNTYESAIKKFREFMEINKYSMTAITEETLVHYVAHMHKNKVSHGTLCQTKPAIKLLLQMQTGDAEVFTQRVSRMLDAAIRKAAGEKEVVKKAAQVDFQVLIDMMEKFVNPFSNNIFEADIFKLRTVVRVVTEYYTFCWGADYRELKEKNVEESGPDLMVTFPKAKNDQLHQGQANHRRRQSGCEHLPVLSLVCLSLDIQCLRLYLFFCSVHFFVENLSSPVVNVIKLFWRKSRKYTFPLKPKHQEYAILKAINSFRAYFCLK